MTRVHTADVAVVGAGPCGLFAAYYAGFRGLSAVLVDSLPVPGGQVSALYPEKLIHDVAGFPAVRGRELVERLVAQAAPYRPTYVLGVQARRLTSDGDSGIELELADGSRVHAGAVLLTAGIGGFTPRPLPAAGGWVDRGVVFFVPDPGAHSGHDVVIVGGGDSAFDWALALHPIARSVTMVHRRDRFRAHQATVEQVRAQGTEIITDAQVTALFGDTQVRGCEIRTGAGEQSVRPAQTVVAALGFVADLGPIRSWGLALDHRGVTVDSHMRTSGERVFAAGDVAQYPGKVRLLASGFGEAATAVNNIAVLLRPHAHLFPGHSSE